MSSGRLRGMRREETRPAATSGERARAERLWQETVSQPPTPADDRNGSDAPLLTPALSSPRGGEGESVGTTHVPAPPTRAAGPDGATAPRAYARKPSERSERPALEGNEQVAERVGARREPVTSRAPRQPADEASQRSRLPAGPATRKLRALWQSAYHLGLIHDRSDDALGAWLRRLAHLDGDTAAAPAGLDRPIQALKAWLARAAGVDWRPHLSLGRDGRVWERRRPRARVLEAQWRLLHRRGRVRIGSEAALGAYAARYAGLDRAESHLALNDAQTDALIRHLGKRIRAASGRHD